MVNRQSSTVRRARTNELHELATRLAAAFYDDPVWGPYFFPDERRRLAGLTRFFAGELRQFLPHGQVWTIEDLAGVTVWAPPGHWQVPPYELLQGNGLGTALLRPVLDRCDTQGAPAYLEATNERNLPLYRRQGFEVREELDLPNGPRLWTMWREPGGG